jgi:D-tyrosyl-tRNA(Tyr) deacylase
VLVVSQFTLCADLHKGNRPSWDPAAPPDVAERLYEAFLDELRRQGVPVEHGTFGAHMHVTYENDGPVTILLDSSTIGGSVKH